ncbi:phasin family protein [Alkalibacillus salilacus]|uniref:Polyhydroxyalkanoate synthesis regulator phasin n=1 Tax=Alkalibacillus salilacus TaxID=284582 RepID=A0ABT9VEA9_9BACI|nr:phasin family protein [Alkalibacillus salilacus]MDQ0159271.1 polyhydroxyalkanoate synthesis regulator phasin [Alkalibacillus salilacus]
MRDTFKKGLSLGLGLAQASKEQVDKVLDEMYDKGELSKSELTNLLNEVRQKGEQRQEEMDQKVHELVKSYLHELNIPTREDYDELEKRIAELEAKHDTNDQS